MIQKRIDKIEINDLLGLVENGVREGKSIEYKQQLPGGTDADKKEFLADISSFANASGGTVVFGVIEARDSNGKASGVPESIAGLANVNADAEVRRLEQMIRDGLEPRIPGIGLMAIDGFPDGPVIVIQIPQSWAAPHMVAFKSSPRFFSRTSAGKSPLNVPEIRAAFLQSEELPKRIRQFREERLGLIVAGETPVPLPQSPLSILHLVPVASFLNPPNVDVLDFLDGRVFLPPMGASGYNSRLNIDGYVSYQGGKLPDDEQFNYAQIFRNGIVEGVDAFILSGHDEKDNFIPSIALEEDLLQGARQYFKAYKAIGISGPVIVMLSLLNVRGFYMHAGNRMMSRTIHRIEKKNLLLPDVIVEDIETPVESSFRPVFDLVWQGCGFRRSFNYDDSGQWNPRN